MDEKKKAEPVKVIDRRGVEDPPPKQSEAEIARAVGAIDASKIGVKEESKHPLVVAAREGRFRPKSGRVLLRAVMPSDLRGTELTVFDGHVRGAVYHVVERIAADVPDRSMRVGDVVMHISAGEDRLDEGDPECRYSLVLWKHIIGGAYAAGDPRLDDESVVNNREAYLRARYGTGLPDDVSLEVLEKMEAEERRQRRETPRWPERLE